MADDIDFAALLAGIPKLAIEREESDEQYCQYARQFQLWVGQLVSPLQEARSVVAINQAKVQLTDKYFAWRALVPVAHRGRVGPKGHNCIFHVFTQTYEKLLALELSLVPPALPHAAPASTAVAPVSPQKPTCVFVGEPADEDEV